MILGGWPTHANLGLQPKIPELFNQTSQTLPFAQNASATPIHQKALTLKTW